MSQDSSSFHLARRLLRAAPHARRVIVEAAYQRYYQRVLGLLVARVPGSLTRHCDPEELAQSAWGSFCHQALKENFHLEHEDSLWPLLATIANGKYADLMARLHTQKRDLHRETTEGEADRVVVETLGKGTSPLEEAAVNDLVEQVAGGLDERQRRILALRLEGCTIAEIAASVKMSQSTVDRALRELRGRWQQLAAALDPDGTDPDSGEPAA